ncbi:adenine nucleotide alpha hydrolases-like protein [Hypoxylon crocopeplum]|nr:adenine nucleotide alpha hydrolases-like protein [Hypoxylon crocopeplum]
MAADGPLSVVALVSGGKDSFYSILHCLANGHRVLALANLHPPTPPPRAARTSRPVTATSIAEAEDALGAQLDSTTTPTSTTAIRISPGDEPASQQHGSPSRSRVGDSDNAKEKDEDEETDLNSFMYQTVGHQVIPLYAQATGLPLFRQAIRGTAVDHGISYQDPDGRHEDDEEDEDETESLVPLLRAVLDAHPDVNALCTGAILSTYQRTRVESVALRLGLVPLAFLWQFPELPLPSCALAAGSDRDDAQLLRDMAAAGLEARVVKVASAGLGEEFLWENVASEVGVSRIQRSLRRFGGGGRGSVLGEGGEFETLVVDGPPMLFKGRIAVRDDDRRVVREGGGSAWLSIREAKVEMKVEANVVSEGVDGVSVRIPNLLDPRFENILELMNSQETVELGYNYAGLSQIPLSSSKPTQFKLEDSSSQNWYFVGSSGGVENQTTNIVDKINERLHKISLPATAITSSVIVLRRMADFPTVNRLYGALFREPNPPARVTISCGNLLLPRDADIAVLLVVQPYLKTKPDHRRGLHVQSRSYWAPANIGPYSQAITYPLLADDSQSINDNYNSSSGSPLAVSIAGQIPLIPASMILPPDTLDGNGNVSLQITLALQHLWRVGAEMQVQWWSSAVAYFPRSSGVDDMRHKALLAATAWKAAHSRATSTDTADGDLDPWDKRYNSLYTSYGSGNDGTTGARPALADWEVVEGFDADADDEETQQRLLPFVFSAEVAELPRAAGVEWHAHLGFANLGSGSVRLCSVVVGGSGGGLLPSLDLHHVAVESPTGDRFVQTVTVYKECEVAGSSFSFEDAVKSSALAVRRSLAELLPSIDDSLPETGDAATPSIMPKIAYVDPELVDVTAGDDVAYSLEGGAIIPCRSLWDPSGGRLGMVSVFETRWVRAR